MSNELLHGALHRCSVDARGLEPQAFRMDSGFLPLIAVAFLCQTSGAVASKQDTGGGGGAPLAPVDVKTAPVEELVRRLDWSDSCGALCNRREVDVGVRVKLLADVFEKTRAVEQPGVAASLPTSPFENPDYVRYAMCSRISEEEDLVRGLTTASDAVRVQIGEPYCVAIIAGKTAEEDALLCAADWFDRLYYSDDVGAKLALIDSLVSWGADDIRSWSPDLCLRIRGVLRRAYLVRHLEFPIVDCRSSSETYLSDHDNVVCGLALGCGYRKLAAGGYEHVEEDDAGYPALVADMRQAWAAAVEGVADGTVSFRQASQWCLTVADREELLCADDVRRGKVEASVLAADQAAEWFRDALTAVERSDLDRLTSLVAKSPDELALAWLLEEAAIQATPERREVVTALDGVGQMAKSAEAASMLRLAWLAAADRSGLELADVDAALLRRYGFRSARIVRVTKPIGK